MKSVLTCLGLVLLIVALSACAGSASEDERRATPPADAGSGSETVPPDDASDTSEPAPRDAGGDTGETGAEPPDSSGVVPPVTAARPDPGARQTRTTVQPTSTRRPALYGTVLLAGSGDEAYPLSKARVTLWLGKKEVASAYSDGKGNYAFWKLPPGEYRMTVLVGGRRAALVDGNETREAVEIALRGESTRRALRAAPDVQQQMAR